MDVLMIHLQPVRVSYSAQDLINILGSLAFIGHVQVPCSSSSGMQHGQASRAFAFIISAVTTSTLLYLSTGYTAKPLDLTEEAKELLEHYKV